MKNQQKGSPQLFSHYYYIYTVSNKELNIFQNFGWIKQPQVQKNKQISYEIVQQIIRKNIEATLSKKFFFFVCLLVFFLAIILI